MNNIKFSVPEIINKTQNKYSENINKEEYLRGIKATAPDVISVAASALVAMAIAVK
ncbi:hypothetical protein ACOIYK_001877 [Vibrio parahaemolyticus]